MSKFCRLRRNERYEVCNDEHRGRGLSVCVDSRIFGFPPLHTFPPNYCQYYPRKEIFKLSDTGQLFFGQ